MASRQLCAWFLIVLCFAGARAAAADLTYLAHEPAEKAAHPPLIVLLHGSGANERDMIGLWPQLPGTFVVVSPRAPIPDGAGGFRWYRNGASRVADIALSRNSVDLLVADAVKRFDADSAKIFIAGFSQGAVMAYDLGLHEPGKFRGVAVLSGSLFPSEAAAHATAPHTVFFVAHGTADPRIPFASATAARAVLARLGVPCEFHAYPGMRHEIGTEETNDLGRWLSEQLLASASK